MPQDPDRLRRSLEIFEATFAFFDLNVLAYRELPVDPAVLGDEARRSLPTMRQAILRRPAHCRTDASFDKLLYSAKQVLRTKLVEQGIQNEFFFASLSARTIVYKALTRAADLDRFYLDLRDPRFATRFAMIHRRFSTNTRTSWDKAQPFRLIAHNGEINTIAGNRSRAVSREMSIGLKPDQLVTHGGISDSGSLNEIAEALHYRSSIPHMEDILAIMMPPAEGQSAFYTFWSRAMEPWDGPAFLVYSDGSSVGARLDRNGFRPARWAMTEDRFYLASEAGSFPLDEAAVCRKGILYAGTGVKLDLGTGRVHFRDPGRSREHRDATFDARTRPVGTLPGAEAAGPVSVFKKTLFTCSREELEKILYPMAATGKEAIGSMGDTARPNVFSSEPRPFFDYFYQHFAQVTNPPLDYIREGNVTDLRVFLGRAPNIFFPKDLLPLNEALELPRPILDLGQMRFLERMQSLRPSESHIIPRTFPMVFRRDDGAAGFHRRRRAAGLGCAGGRRAGHQRHHPQRPGGQRGAAAHPGPHRPARRGPHAQRIGPAPERLHRHAHRGGPHLPPPGGPHQLRRLGGLPLAGPGDRPPGRASQLRGPDPGPAGAELRQRAGIRPPQDHGEVRHLGGAELHELQALHGHGPRPRADGDLLPGPRQPPRRHRLRGTGRRHAAEDRPGGPGRLHGPAAAHAPVPRIAPAWRRRAPRTHLLPGPACSTACVALEPDTAEAQALVPGIPRLPEGGRTHQPAPPARLPDRRDRPCPWTRWRMSPPSPAVRRRRHVLRGHQRREPARPHPGHARLSAAAATAARAARTPTT